MRKIRAICLPAFITFLLLEATLRFAGYPPLASWPSSEGYFWVCDQKLGWKNRSSGSHVLQSIASRPLSTTDGFGFRNGLSGPPDPDKPVVLLIGDSVVFCSEVNDENTSSSELARLLKDKARVLNAGVRGYNTVQSLRMMEECLRRFPNIRTVVYVYCPNDYFENIIPDVYAPARAPTAFPDGEGGALKLIEAQIAAPEGMDFVSGRKTDLGLFLRSHFATAVAAGIIRSKIKTITRKQEDLTPLKEWAAKAGADKVLMRLISRMDDLCRQRGIGFLTVDYDFRHDYPFPEYSEMCRKAGVSFVETRDRFSGDQTSYLAWRMDGSFDCHLGPRGTRTFAEALAPAVGEALGRLARDDPKPAQ
ncbi:MAG: hypothetical protein LLG06_13085 [Desulfobacteraceae bacterium]|nr:hypothetical protein [Desulfobacteraceae bacterium]